MTHGPLRDSKTDLLEAAQAAVKDREEKAAELVVASSSIPRRRRLGTLAVIGLAGVVLLALQPAWLIGPGAAPPDPPPMAAAGLRVAMVRQRQLLFNYARANGRLPRSLSETGDSLPGVRYTRRSDSTFTLTASAGGSEVVLQSSDTQAVFLGNSLRILKNRGAQ